MRQVVSGSIKLKGGQQSAPLATKGPLHVTSSVLYRCVDHSSESGDVTKQIIWIDEHIEISCNQAATHRARVFRISCSMVSAMIQRYSHQLATFWEMLAKTVQYYDDRVLFSTDYLLYCRVMSDSQGRAAYKIYEAIKYLDGGVKWKLEFLTNIQHPFDIEIRAQLSPEYDRKHIYRIGQQHMKPYFEKHCLEMYSALRCHGAAVESIEKKPVVEVAENIYYDDDGYGHGPPAAAVAAPITKEDVAVIDGGEDLSLLNEPNHMLNAFMNELIYDKDTDQLLIANIERIKLEEFVDEIGAEDEKAAEAEYEDTDDDEHHDLSKLFVSNKDRRTALLPSEGAGLIVRPISPVPPYEKYSQLLTKDTDEQVEGEKKASEAFVAPLTVEVPEVDVGDVSAVVNPSVARPPDSRGAHHFIRSVSTIHHRSEDFARKLDVIAQENHNTIRKFIKEANGMMHSESIPALPEEDASFVNADTKLLVVREALAVKASYRSAISVRAIIDYLQTNTSLGAFLSYCSFLDLCNIVEHMTLLDIHRDINGLQIIEGDSISRVFVVLQGSITVCRRGAEEEVIKSGELLGDAVLKGGFCWEYSAKNAFNGDLHNESVILCQLPVESVFRYIGCKNEHIEDDMVHFWKSLRLWVEIKFHNRKLEDLQFQALAAGHHENTFFPPPSERFHPIDVTRPVRLRIYQAGMEIFQQGQPRNYMYIMKQGSATYFRVFPPDKVGTDIVPERVEIADSDHPVGITDVHGNIIDENGGCKGYILSGDFSIMDSDDIFAIDRLEDLDYQLMKLHEHESVKSIEYHKRKFHRYDKHRNTLVANTRCEVYVLPLRETAKSTEVFRSLIQLSNVRYPELLISDEKVIHNYHERQAWLIQRKEVFKEIQKDLIDKRLAEQHTQGVNNNLSHDLYLQRQPGGVNPVMKGFMELVTRGNSGQCNKQDNNENAQTLAANELAKMFCLKTSSPLKAKETSASSEEGNLQYVHKLQAVIKHYSRHQQVDQQQWRRRTGISVAAELPTSPRAPAGRPSTAIVPSSPRKSLDVQEDSDNDSSEELWQLLRSDARAPRPTTSQRIPKELLSRAVRQISPGRTSPQSRSPPPRPRSQGQRVRRHGLIVKMQNVHDLVIQTEGLKQFKQPTLPVDIPSSKARSAPNSQQRKLRQPESESTARPSSSSAAVRKPGPSKRAEAMQLIAKHHVGQYVRQQSMGRDQQDEQKKRPSLAPHEYVKIFKDRAVNDPMLRFYNEFAQASAF